VTVWRWQFEECVDCNARLQRWESGAGWVSTHSGSHAMEAAGFGDEYWAYAGRTGMFPPARPRALSWTVSGSSMR
jgi:hypothetical protein